ncbi:hypothetical protein NP233_g6245 [Leucocoprinus birnbaumii]|uniref:Uncharacterized protein n=1 Tax=Leucocoprinus birnbaumii TaxID=56174 RepID=A0AAD5VTN2_9AGAR|nr:hypothetical protein NP233_g6245 [Leucocoprinus birnbaumii]
MNFEHLNKSDCFDLLKDRRTVRPRALKLIRTDVVHSWTHHITIGQHYPEFANSISLDRLKSLYIAYKEDNLAYLIGRQSGQWLHVYIREFLELFGHSVEELVLEVDHRQVDDRHTTVPALTSPQTPFSTLTNLKSLTFNLYTGPHASLSPSLSHSIQLLLTFIQSLPSPSSLTSLRILFFSTFQWSPDMSSEAEVFEELFNVIASGEFEGLEKVRVDVKLICEDVPSRMVMVEDSKECVIRSRDYSGISELRERGIDVRFRTFLLSG